mgnify:CR=1 FL=1
MAVRDMQERMAQRAPLPAFVLSAIGAILFWGTMPLGFVAGSLWHGVQVGFQCGKDWES